MTNQVDTAEDMAEIVTSQQRVSCNGGGDVLGHPLVWLTLGSDGKVVCPYCSRTYVKAAADKTIDKS